MRRNELIHGFTTQRTETGGEVREKIVRWDIWLGAPRREFAKRNENVVENEGDDDGGGSGGGGGRTESREWDWREASGWDGTIKASRIMWISVWA